MASSVLYGANRLAICLCFSWVLIALPACQEEQKKDYNVSGYWQIVDAARNGKPTLTLENAYIHFRRDSLLQTNLLSGDIESPYIQTDHTIVQKLPSSIVYEISSLSADTLVLNTEIKGYEFLFTMVYVDSLSTQN